ncbi:MAG: hypothetical protein WA642_07500 [Steroidobacteraceae bacterium]
MLATLVAFSGAALAEDVKNFPPATPGGVALQLSSPNESTATPGQSVLSPLGNSISPASVSNIHLAQAVPSTVTPARPSQVITNPAVPSPTQMVAPQPPRSPQVASPYVVPQPRPAVLYGGNSVTITLGNTFRFAIVGATRPAKEDDIANYPMAIINTIWNDIETSSPHPDFAISAGTYAFSSDGAKATESQQLSMYLAARGRFTGQFYPAMGNHECTGQLTSNCGPGNPDGTTSIYTAFMSLMLYPLRITLPYYEINLVAQDGSWTAKIVVMAANAWNSAQATWLDQTLAQPTTYTFVVRTESAFESIAPGFTPSEAIINRHPFTLEINGQPYTYAYYPTQREVIVGNGGAPLSAPVDYGFAILERLASGVLQFSEYDYQTKALNTRLRINADGSPAP